MHFLGFTVGHTSDPETKGILIRAMVHPDRNDSYLILLDTEGTGSTEKVKGKLSLCFCSLNYDLL